MNIRIKLILCALCALLGCGSGSSSSTTSGSGEGGQPSTAASTTGATTASSNSGGQGGSGTSQIIGNNICAGKEMTIAPILNEAVDKNGKPINENGAIPLWRITPPSYPFTFAAWSYVLVAGVGPCGKLAHSAVAFVGPAAAPQLHPADARVAQIDPSTLDWKGTHAGVMVQFNPPVVLHQNEVLWAGPRLPASDTGRACVLSCDGGGVDADSWYSATNADAMVDVCPDTSCSFQPLAVSPDPVTAATYGNNNRRWLYTATGHQ